MTPNWSSEQHDIFSWFENKPPNLLDENPIRTLENLVVVAYAGTGKTTTIVEGANRAPEASILMCAYNKRIAEELVTRVTNPHVTVKTLHSVGYAAVLRYWERIRASFDSSRKDKLNRADSLAEQVCGPTAPDAIKRLVSKLHTKGREIAPHASITEFLARHGKNTVQDFLNRDRATDVYQPGQLADLAITFELEPEESWEGTGYDLAYVEVKALEAMELAATVRPEEIDGSDMIFLPVRNGWLHKSYDLVVVDEAQDMTVAQLEIAQGVCRGRICVVGDPNQAIYGFRGADSNSISRLKKEMEACQLGLTTTYRCGRRIVELAQAFVPDFKAGPGNPEGVIENILQEKLVTTAGPGDFILSRLNAPLVSIAMSLLRNGKRTRVAGRDIGAGLKALVRKLRGRSIPDMLAKISAWETKQAARLKKAGREDRVEAVHDQAEMLVSLTDGARNVDEVVDRIDALFTDDGLGQAGVITCSSVHRAKGLEANRVFILRGTLRDHNQEEKNIQYVAITRAKQTLVWVD